jgi:hypothetical protein
VRSEVMLGEAKTVVAKLVSETDLFDSFAISLGLAASRVNPWDTGQNTDFHGLCLARPQHKELMPQGNDFEYY